MFPTIPLAPCHPVGITPQAMRHTLAGFATGIAVVAAEVEGSIVGLSTNSFTSVSLDPPLVSVSFGRTSTSWPVLRRAPRWGISVLGEDGAAAFELLRRPSADRFRALDTNVTEDGAAFVSGSLATITVEVHAEFDAGDHVLTLLRVLSLDRDQEQEPLVYFGRSVRKLASRQSL